MNRLLASMLVLSLGLAACAEATSPGGGGTGQEPALRGVTWILDGSSIGLLGGGDPGQARGSIRFDDDGAGGTAFCNHYGGTYTLGDDGAITIEPGAMTEMACEEPLMSLESAFIAALGEVTSYRFDGDALVLAGDVELRFDAEQPTPLVGPTWAIDGLVDRQVATSVLAGTDPHIVFGQDGAEGDAGCNTFIAQYTVDGQALSFGPIEATEMACQEPGVMDQEAAILRALSSTAGFEIQGASMTLKDAAGAPLMTLVVLSD